MTATLLRNRLLISDIIMLSLFSNCSKQKFGNGPIKWSEQRDHDVSVCLLSAVARAPSQYPKIRLFVRSRKVSKPRDLYLELSDRSEIWQALRQHSCRCACQISKRYDNLRYQSRGFKTSRDLTKRRLFRNWGGAQNPEMRYHYEKVQSVCKSVLAPWLIASFNQKWSWLHLWTNEKSINVKQKLENFLIRDAIFNVTFITTSVILPWLHRHVILLDFPFTYCTALY